MKRKLACLLTTLLIVSTLFPSLMNVLPVRAASNATTAQESGGDTTTFFYQFADGRTNTFTEGTMLITAIDGRSVTPLIGFCVDPEQPYRSGTYPVSTLRAARGYSEKEEALMALLCYYAQQYYKGNRHKAFAAAQIGFWRVANELAGNSAFVKVTGGAVTEEDYARFAHSFFRVFLVKYWQHPEAEHIKWLDCANDLDMEKIRADLSWTGYLLRGGSSQDVAGFSFTEKGRLSLQKKPAFPAVTEGNPCYSLEGAVYGVYTDPAATNEAARLTTNADGATNEVQLSAGTYYVKEIQPSPGYELDAGIYPVNVKAGNTALTEVTEQPALERRALLITKEDTAAGAHPQGSASLTGAAFTVRYYSTTAYGSAEELSAAGVEPDRIWTIEGRADVDESGETVFLARLDEEHLLSGDPFFEANGRVVLPLGTLLIEETAAPEGYLGSGQVVFTRITEQDGSAASEEGAEFLYQNRVIRGDISLTKRDADTQAPMAGVTFLITSLTTGESHPVVTDENGYASTASSYISHADRTNEGGGVWFGEGEPDDAMGALPYDTYRLEEVPGEANAGMRMITQNFTVSRESFHIDLGTLQNLAVHIGTSAVEEESGTKYALADGSVCIIDTVRYTNLTAGGIYRLCGQLMDKESGEAVVDASGQEVTAETVFSADTQHGSAEVYFLLDASNLHGRDVVVFEQLYEDDICIAAHEDLEDAGQTIHFPRIGTTAVDEKTEDHIALAQGDVHLTDTVRYENLAPGREYVLEGRLLYRSSLTPVKDAGGNDVTAKTSFVPQEADGAAQVSFSFPAPEGLAGEETVVYERLFYGSRLIAEHEDPNDADQIISFPRIATKAGALATGEAIVPAEEEAVITDTVRYEGLIPGKEYILSGVLADKETGMPLLLHGQEVRSEMAFTPEEASGEETLSFTLDTTALAGKSIVVYENLLYKEKPVAIHEDPDDEAQTVRVPAVATTARDKKSGTKNLLAEEGAGIIDSVTCRNLIPGKEYRVVGTLAVQASGEALMRGSESVSSETVFTAEKETEVVEVAFDLDAAALGGTEIIVFEELFMGEASIARHCDLDAASQMISIPEIRTSAKDKASGTKEAEPAKQVIIEDTVSWRGLRPGETYKLTGVLMDKETNKAIQKDGKTLTAEVSFTPETTAGETTVTFTVDATSLAGKKLVVFETLTQGDHTVAVHCDLEDEAQTITVKEKPVSQTKRGKRPATGDNSREEIQLFILLGLGAIIAAAGVFVYKTKKF